MKAALARERVAPGSVVNVTDVRPVTAETWPDLVALFTARGGPHYCFCTPYRVAGSQHLSGNEGREAMQGLVEHGVPVGVLAYKGDEPLGWCSVAPRETYARLARSRTMPRVSPPETSTWTVLCFFVPRPVRSRGVSSALLAGAVRYAEAEGAEEIEGYPFDTVGISAPHRGHSSIFAAAGFRRDGRRWSRALTRPEGGG